MAASPSRPERNWHRPDQVAERLGVSSRTVRRWLAYGELPHIVLPGGRLIRVPSDALEAWLESRVVGTPKGGGRPGHLAARPKT
jgi:excisionase family DNA binding protein